jgi:hypothetical protein
MYTGSPFTGPSEYGSDAVEVDADNKRQAIVLGVKELRRINSHWLQDQTSDGHSPFTGLRAEILELPDYEGPPW